MRGKKRPTSERVRALGIAVLEGPEAAAEQTGIPRRTVAQWMTTPEFADLRQRTKEQVAEEWWAIVQRGFRKTAELLDGTTDAQKAATATAIIADKMLLIRGEATTRYESRDVTNDLSDHERDLLNSAIRGELARRTDEHPTQDAVVGAETPGAEAPAG